MGAGSREEADDRVSEGSHHLGSRPSRHLAAVLVKGHVPHPMDLILDAPVTPPQLEQACRTCLFRGQTSDGVGPLS